MIVVCFRCLTLPLSYPSDSKDVDFCCDPEKFSRDKILVNVTVTDLVSHSQNLNPDLLAESSFTIDQSGGWWIDSSRMVSWCGECEM